MFKKTVIAAALAAVTGSAMADVTVSGKVEQGFVDVDGAADGWSGYTDNEIYFKASEDLGNGLTAFAQITLDADSTDADTDAAHSHTENTAANYTQDATTGDSTAASRTGTENSDMKVGITGGFGTVVVGRMEDFTESKLAATMSLMGPGAGFVELAGNATRQNNAIAYVSPAFNGLTIGVAGFTGLGTGDDFDATDIMLSYTNGPLTVMAAQESTNNAGAAALGVAEDTTSFAVKYAMGDLSGAVLAVDRENQGGVATADSNDLMFRIDYKMGANKITLADADDDDNNNNDATTVELSHAFSNRTTVYVGHANRGGTTADETYVGLQHAF